MSWWAFSHFDGFQRHTKCDTIYWKIYLARFNLGTVCMHVNTHRGITQKDCSNLQRALQPLSASRGGLKPVFVWFAGWSRVCGSGLPWPKGLGGSSPRLAGVRAVALLALILWPCSKWSLCLCLLPQLFFFCCSVGTKRSFCFEDVPLKRKRFKYFRSAH